LSHTSRRSACALVSGRPGCDPTSRFRLRSHGERVEWCARGDGTASRMVDLAGTVLRECRSAREQLRARALVAHAARTGAENDQIADSIEVAERRRSGATPRSIVVGVRPGPGGRV
jgi:hypothetical protein